MLQKETTRLPSIKVKFASIFSVSYMDIKQRKLQVSTTKRPIVAYSYKEKTKQLNKSRWLLIFIITQNLKKSMQELTKQKDNLHKIKNWPLIEFNIKAFSVLLSSCKVKILIE